LTLAAARASKAASSASADHRKVPWQLEGETLRLAVTRQLADGPAVLYVHGATFPAALSVGWRMRGVSWMDQLQSGGMDAWAFDFAGYGGSDRPRAFELDAKDTPPFGAFRDAARQVIAVLEAIQRERPNVPICVIAHSWGTVPAQQVAIDRPDLVSRLVLFGPVVPRDGAPDPAPEGEMREPAWQLISAAMQRPRQRTGLPADEPTPVSELELERWCAAYLDSDPYSRQREPRAAKVPNGPGADIAQLWAGEVLVDSRRIRQPTLIVRGEWDHVTTDADAKRLFASLADARDRRDVKISGGNHWLHLQPRRMALWAETLSFLREETFA
jgi:pimeloyl-ACP methyl ester carboxylesterase